MNFPQATGEGSRHTHRLFGRRTVVAPSSTDRRAYFRPSQYVQLRGSVCFRKSTAPLSSSQRSEPTTSKRHEQRELGRVWRTLLAISRKCQSIMINELIGKSTLQNTPHGRTLSHESAIDRRHDAQRRRSVCSEYSEPIIHFRKWSLKREPDHT